MTFNAQFDGKVIAITGGASGIGLATAHLLASRGAKISLADIQKDALDKTKADIEARISGAQVMTQVVDVRHYDQVDSWIKATVEKFGRLDGAANLAGVISKYISIKPLSEQDFEMWDFVIGVNLTGVMHCMRSQLRIMADGGAIVNASSIAGNTGRACNSDYTASKHGVIGLTRSAAKEVGGQNIRVNAICPGYIATPMVAKSKEIAHGTADVQRDMSFIGLGREGKPEEVAKLIAFLLSDDASYISGANIAIDGAWNC
ncbi:3-oxoacyl-reductase [Microdochium trichocladiopsis]|uniref:3-oxoacyl-reductase n=1 Tax=Microdochium trichocladiopsis TaxID=1682393 RepID=A0A9P8Y408_9PEZI|nr:3-oxoacyl-reductase [Microdochium trichocladiopsis]KAH7028984.1 3-oxoacyl-reductase [Microdochium trichocladiopsis]